jgi:CheY-like chemotaxis protein
MTRVLIVDDEQDILDSLAEYFEDSGFEVATAGNGAEAWTLLSSGDIPDVVLLDLLMPVMGGNVLYDRMQADPKLAQIPVIISTSDPTRAPSGLVIMKKPMKLERLLGVVRQAAEPQVTRVSAISY